MLIPGRHANTSDYRYGFNGKEKDDELKGEGNSLDFGARMYDPRVGRWFALDPLAAKYPAYTPYSFVNNSPLIHVDPDGKDIIYVGNWTKKEKRHQKAMLKMSYGKAVYKRFKNSKTDDIYIAKSSVPLDGKAALTIYNVGRLWKDDTYYIKNLVGITPTFDYNGNRYTSFYKRWKIFQGLEINNQEARVHMILVAPINFKFDEFKQAEIMLHELIAHVLIPLLNGQAKSDYEFEHTAYGSDTLDDNTKGTIADDVNKDADKARDNKDNENYDSGSDGQKELEHVGEVVNKEKKKKKNEN